MTWIEASDWLRLATPPPPTVVSQQLEDDEDEGEEAKYGKWVAAQYKVNIKRKRSTKNTCRIPASGSRRRSARWAEMNIFIEGKIGRKIGF